MFGYLRNSQAVVFFPQLLKLSCHPSTMFMTATVKSREAIIHLHKDKTRYY